ncbi:DinB family protein [Plantactinospora sp. GCM10030261]|uniref:DinB family protein n=1 Tax=Plantactinospora sp. GCM10030261 TaxID=3273420 RepID=UPI003620465A
MSEDPKPQLHKYLSAARDAVIWKAEGLSEYDVRRPLTRTGTNLLGLVKHLSIVEAWYFGTTFDRPFTPHLPWWDDDAAEGDDLWVTASESRQEILDTYQAAIAHADETIRSLDLDAPGHVPWWPRPDVTLHTMLVHVIAETARHAGHADILREQLDGRTGMRPDNLNQEPHDDRWWADHRARIESVARSAGGGGQR